MDADLYQIHDPELIPLAYLLKRTTGGRIVYDMHEDYRSKGGVWGRVLRILERWCFRWADHVFLAEESYRSIVEDAPVSHTCILNYFTPIGEEWSSLERSSSESKSPTRLLYTGTVADSRGLDTMLELAAAIRRRDRPEHLDIIGICNLEDQRARVEDRIQNESLSGVVTRVGWDSFVFPSEMGLYYRRAGVGLFLGKLHTNFTRSLPTKFYEYLHYGLPIICSDFPRWRQFVEENECGAVVPLGDATAVLEVIDRWRERPEEYRQLVHCAREAASQYRWNRMETRLVRVYRGLLS